jgi:hypothetical protein
MLMKKIAFSLAFLTVLLCATAFAQNQPGHDPFDDFYSDPAPPPPVAKLQPITAPVQAAGGLPQIAVCVTGDLSDNKKKILGRSMLTSLVNTGRYSNLERHVAFAEALGKEAITQSDGTVNNSLILALGKQHGAGYVCIVSTTPFSEDEYQVFALIINVETAQAAAMGDAYSPLKTSSDVRLVLNELIRGMFPEDAPATPAPVTPRSEPSQTAIMAAPPAAAPESAAAQAVTAVAAVADAVLFKPKKITILSPNPQAILNALKDVRPGDTIAVTIPIPAQMGMAAKMLKPKDIVVPLYGTTAKEIGSTLTSAKPKPGDTVKLVIPTLSDMANGAVGVSDGDVKIRKLDWYLAPKYHIPVTWAVANWGGIGLEGGIIWGNGWFIGLEPSFSYGGTWGGDDYDWAITLGGSINFGNTCALAEDLRLVYGLSAGPWYLETSVEDADIDQFAALAIGPFARLRWRFLEFSYRGLVGHYVSFQYNSQLMLGLYFATDKRNR